MSTYKVAHIREQGVDLIIIPLDSSFGYKSSSDQNDIIDALQACAANAGLAGGVVPVWLSGSTRHWICPPNWNPFFETFDWDDLMLNLNIELTCG